MSKDKEINKEEKQDNITIEKLTGACIIPLPILKEFISSKCVLEQFDEFLKIHRDPIEQFRKNYITKYMNETDDLFEEVIYISGKITGEENYKEKFAKAEEELIQLGYKVLNPAKLDQIHADLEYKDYMTLCYAMIDISDSLYFLEDWTESPGAIKEYHYAEVHDKKLYYEAEYRRRLRNRNDMLCSFLYAYQVLENSKNGGADSDKEDI